MLNKDNTIWFDLTTSVVNWRGGVSGIIRTELFLAKHFYKIKNVKFFILYEGEIEELSHSLANKLFESGDLYVNYRELQDLKNNLDVPVVNHEAIPDLVEARSCQNKLSRLKNATLLLLSILPNYFSNVLLKTVYRFKNRLVPVIRKLANRNTCPIEIIDSSDIETKINNIFADGDTILSVGLDWSHVTHDKIEEIKLEKSIKFKQLIYDLTPVKTPQFHSKQSQDAYHDFLKKCTDVCDEIIFGGNTARNDGINYFKENNWHIPSSKYVKFGSDISKSETDGKDIVSKLLGGEDYILTVGTIEIRKNHDVLYKAYLNLLERKIVPPTLIIVGSEGWKVESFYETILNDSRISDFIKILSPSDLELDALYKNCLFTVLPSMYEGWSLTLPESLNYNKFCLASDNEPLREVGCDFVEYIHSMDVVSWANKIHYYHSNKYELKTKEKYIKNEWNSILWSDFFKEMELIVKEAD